jgi:uncharacterized membrane protein YfcA
MHSDWTLAAMFFVVAILYSSVGHAGASGYLAAMGLVGFVPEVMKPTALVLNLIVSGIGTFRFWRAGFFRWRIFWPFAITSIPLAYLGGRWKLHERAYFAAVGVVLILSAVRLAVEAAKRKYAEHARKPPIAPALVCGGGIGLLSGTTGTGGGIFLSPLLLTMNWATIRETSAVAAMFILVNSAAGLLGNLTSTGKLPHATWLWAIAVILGGLIGTELGARRLAPKTLRYLLSIVLLLAGTKLLAGK